MIGSGTKIFDTDFHSVLYEDRLNGDRNVTSAPVHICEGAFIGACSIILKGVTIGKHSVIGAGSVVTKDVPDNEIWAGNPAKYVKDLQLGGAVDLVDTYSLNMRQLRSVENGRAHRWEEPVKHCEM